MVTYYEPGNVESLAAAIGRLYELPVVRATQAAKAQEFLRQYGWEAQGSALVSMYHNLVGETTA
jgi:hypothetical protein